MLNQFAVEIPTLPVNQCCSLHIWCWGLHSYRRAAKKGRQAFGTHMVYRETYLQIHMHLHQLFILKNWINGVRQLRSRFICLQRRKVKWKARTKSRSEMPVWTVSQRFGHPQWRRLFKESWGRPTTTADFGSSLWQVPHTSDVCLLEDKVQDRGMYLFAIPYGSDAMDQRSGVGWFSGLKNFVIYSWCSNAEIWSTRCEACFSIEQNHP